MLEQQIERSVVRWAEANGWMARKVEYPGRAGAPDRWFFGPGGRLVIIEFKRPNGILSEPQKREIQRLADLGFDVHVCRSIEAAKEVLGEATS